MRNIIRVLLYILNITRALEIPLYNYNHLQLGFSVRVTVQEPAPAEPEPAIRSQSASAQPVVQEEEATTPDCDDNMLEFPGKYSTLQSEERRMLEEVETEAEDPDPAPS